VVTTATRIYAAHGLGRDRTHVHAFEQASGRRLWSTTVAGDLGGIAAGARHVALHVAWATAILDAENGSLVRRIGG
jgi:hypothetical protein